MSVAVSVVIVSYNARNLLARCLDSVLAAEGFGPDELEVIVVDNASTDDSAGFVREHYAHVRVVEAGRNGGMAYGNNVGMLAARGRWFLLLNSDAFPDPAAIRRLLDGLEQHPRAAMAVPRLRNQDGTLQRSVRGFPSVWRLATEFLYLRKVGPRSGALNAFYGWPFAHDQERDVEWAMGAAMLVHRAAVDEIGLMEESFFMYGEEVDWQRRMQRAGWSVRFIPGAEVVHLGGGSSRENWGRLYPVQVVNHVRYLALNEGLPTARRARALLLGALAWRSVLYRVAAFAPGGGAARRQRAEGFARARAQLASVDPARLVSERHLPDWPPAL